MVKATRRRDEGDETSESGPRIVVVNMFRTQPVSFQYIGGSVRLGPMESAEIDRRYLASPELAQLVATGAVTVTDSPAGSERATPSGEEDDRPARSARVEK